MLNDGLLTFPEHGLYEHCYLYRAAQLRVYLKKEECHGPVSRVNLHGKRPEEFTIDVTADSPGHRQSIESDGTYRSVSRWIAASL